MLLYQPQVQLFHDLVLGGPKEYKVHAVTFCDLTNLSAAGYQIHSPEPDENQTITIDLFLREDPEKPRLVSLNPVVHTIELGPVDFSGEGFIETRVILQPLVRSRSGDSESTTETAKGKTTSSTTSSKQVDRPEIEWVVPVLFRT